MFRGRSAEIVNRLASDAGLTLGREESADLRVHDDRFYRQVLLKGSLGLGESYMAGWWESEALDEVFLKIQRAGAEDDLGRARLALTRLASFLRNGASRWKAYEVAERHYDLGNDLFEAMLDRRMVYTCGYWRDAANIEEAQEAKLDLVCRKLGVKEGDRLLDIGCGWGSLLGFAAERYGASGVGLTISGEQAALARERLRRFPVEIRVEDYRDFESSKRFDHIVSLGMFEHVGYRNYRNYMRIAHRHLKPSGLFLLQTIGSERSVRTVDPWLGKYIFPNSMLPSVAQIGRAVEGLFRVEDLHSFGPDYDRTLLAWHAKFEAAWDLLRSRYDERFRRMWRYYLLSCAGTFRARRVQLWQIVLARTGSATGYIPVR